MEQKDLGIATSERFKTVESGKAVAISQVRGLVIDLDFVEVEDGGIEQMAKGLYDDPSVISIQKVEVGENLDRQGVRIGTKILKQLDGRVFLGGQVFTKEQIERLPTDDNFSEENKRRLVQNMDGSGIDKVIKTRVGIWADFRKDDRIFQKGISVSKAS